jgi:hypothetical protein
MLGKVEKIAQKVRLTTAISNGIPDKKALRSLGADVDRALKEVRASIAQIERLSKSDMARTDLDRRMLRSLGVDKTLEAVRRSIAQVEKLAE